MKYMFILLLLVISQIKKSIHEFSPTLKLESTQSFTDSLTDKSFSQ